MKDNLLLETCRYFNVTDDFILTEVSPIEGIPVQSIEQNLYSFSFLKKSIFYADSSVIFLEALLRFFQELENFEVVPRYYEAYSHALTFYILRMLERAGIIGMLFSYESLEGDLFFYYQSLGNKYNREKIKMYDIVFYKIRSLNMEDSDLIRRICTLCRIDMNHLRISSTNDKLLVTLNKRLLLENLLSGKVVNQGIDQIKNYLLLSEGGNMERKRKNKK